MNIKLKDFILNKYDEETFSLISEVAETIVCPKGKVITNYGDIEQFCYFIEEGIVEVEITNNKNFYLLDILFETEIFSSYISYLKKTPSDVCLRASSDCILIKVPLTFFQESENILIKQFFLEEIIRYTVKRVEREKDFFLLNAKERYLKIVKNNKKMISEIPLYKLASYLKVSPERLSRIRKEIS